MPNNSAYTKLVKGFELLAEGFQLLADREAEPTSTDPTPTEPTLTESTPTEPTPIKPTPTEPTPIKIAEHYELPTIDCISRIMRAKCDEGKKSEVKELLMKYGARKASDIKPNDRNFFFRELEIM